MTTLVTARRGDTVRNDHYTFGAVVRMEWIKLRSVRSTWWLLLATVAAMTAAGAGVGIGYRGHRPLASAAQIVDNALAGALLAQLFIGTLGVLVVSGEYSSGQIRTTFAAVPRRGIVLAAKAVILGGTALAAGFASSFAAFVAGQVSIAGSGIPRASLGDASILRPVLLTGVYLGAIGLAGMGLGALTRRTGGAIGTLFAGIFVPMFLAAIIGSAGIAVLKFLPLFILINSVAVVTPVPGTLSAWAGVGVTILYAAVALASGWAVVARRDV
jgi:ABC-2 type transport system permease protein